MKLYLKLLLQAVPFGLGVSLSLISISYAIRIVGERHFIDNIIGSIIFGIIGFPLVVASMIKFANEFPQQKDSSFKICPFCAEKIQMDAVKCKYCQETLK